MTATERAAAESARRAAEMAQYGCKPGEGIIAATLRQNDPHAGAGFTPADEQAMIVADKAAQTQRIAELEDKNRLLANELSLARSTVRADIATIEQLKTSLAEARDINTELTQDNEILRGELDTARAWRWAVGA